MQNSPQMTQFRRRLELQSRGIAPPTVNGVPLSSFISKGTGAGPQGKTFHMRSAVDNEFSSMISLPIYGLDHWLGAYAIQSEYDSLKKIITATNGAVLKSRTIPSFLRATLKDGTPMMEIGISTHCYATAVSVYAHECKHFADGLECRYCELEPVGKGINEWAAKQDIDKFVEAVALASQQGVRSLTITSGTFADNDVVVRELIDLVKKIKERVNISVHIQHEPVKDLSLIAETAKYADSLGIFLEILDEDIRKEICPGKSRCSRDDYIRNWEAAVAAYGKNSVNTTCILGFGEKYEKVLQSIDEFASIGVLTTLLLVRPHSNHLVNMVPSYLKHSLDDLVSLYLEAARRMHHRGLSFGVGNSAGCIGCQGCTSMVEAYEIASQEVV